MLPTSSEITYFVEVAQTLNISRAAERLGVSQPTLSLAIKRLEDSFGLPLLLRTKSGVKLTPAGAKFQKHSLELLREWERLRDSAVKDESELRGTYTVGCHPSVALYALPAFLPDLLSENPGLEIRLVHDLSRRITEDVISFKIDFGIVVNPWKHPDLVIRQLCKDEVTLWSSPNSKSPEADLEKMLLCDPDLLQTQAILRQLSKKKSKFGRMLTSPNLEVIGELVSTGMGVGILPGRVARRFNLKPFPIGVNFFDLHCLVFRADAQKSKASRAIAKFIETHVIEN